MTHTVSAPKINKHESINSLLPFNFEHIINSIDLCIFTIFAIFDQINENYDHKRRKSLCRCHTKTGQLLLFGIRLTNTCF